MANCVIGDPPVFSEEIVKWDKQTDADGQAMGQVIEQLLNNTVYNKQAAERAKSYVDVTFSAAGWIGETAPYTQSVAAEGLTEEDTPTPSFVDDGTDEDDSKARQEAYGCITYFDSGDGTVTATCKYKKPESDCTVRLKGV